MTFADLSPGAIACVNHVGGHGSFRRRLMELGILPGTRVKLVGVAPLGDPLELLVRGASLSIRRAEAEQVDVSVISAVEAAAGATRAKTPPELVVPRAQGER